MDSVQSFEHPVLRDDGGGIVNAMTIDVEDYFHVAAFENCIDPADWDGMEHRVARNTMRVLELLEDAGARATFFVLGWVGERYPEVVKEIHAAGHEVACHGYMHQRATGQSVREFREDVDRARKILEDVISDEVVGYRAPTYSINTSNLWAYEVLSELGFRYSSSIYPVRHDLYGIPGAPRYPFHVARGKMVEIPISTIALKDRNLPCGGGGYFRLLPYFYTRWSLATINGREQKPFNFYFHPWEIDSDQPRIRQASLKSKFRHYANLSRMESKLRRLLSVGTWQTMRHVYGINQ